MVGYSHSFSPTCRDAKRHTFACYSAWVDALERSDVEFARRATPEQKLAQALEMMRVGLQLKKQNLRRANPTADAAELRRLYLAWLLSDE